MIIQLTNIDLACKNPQHLNHVNVLYPQGDKIYCMKDSTYKKYKPNILKM